MRALLGELLSEPGEFGESRALPGELPLEHQGALSRLVRHHLLPGRGNGLLPRHAGDPGGGGLPALCLMSVLASVVSDFLGVSFLATPGVSSTATLAYFATTASDSLEELVLLLERINSLLGGA